MTDITENQLQVRQHMALRDLWYPLVDPQVDRQVLGCLNEQCNHCGFFFWIKECTGVFFEDHTIINVML
jgi:hypothetical protein